MRRGKMGKMGKMGYEEWRVGNVAESWISCILSDVVADERAVVVFQVKEMGSVTPEVQRTSSS